MYEPRKFVKVLNLNDYFIILLRPKSRKINLLNAGEKTTFSDLMSKWIILREWSLDKFYFKSLSIAEISFSLS
jgi:hypothetical protein